MFPIIFRKRMAFLCVAFPLATFLILNVYNFSAFYNLSISLLHSITMLITIQSINLMGLIHPPFVEKPIMLKLCSSVLFPLFSVGYILYSILNMEIKPISMYFLGLIAMFASLNGLLINSEVNYENITLVNLELLHMERLNVIWPYIFFFVITFLSTPFIPVLKDEINNPKSLYASICVGAIGFTTLIIIPFDNLRSVREKIADMKKS